MEPHANQPQLHCRCLQVLSVPNCVCSHTFKPLTIKDAHWVRGSYKSLTCSTSSTASYLEHRGVRTRQ
eukprot:1159257-Pelagomonas_calceolata.AAC.1